jgi:hypothetical protein
MQSNDPGTQIVTKPHREFSQHLLPLVIPSEAAVPQRGTMPTRNPEDANRNHAATGNFCDQPPCHSERSEKSAVEIPVSPLSFRARQRFRYAEQCRRGTPSRQTVTMPQQGISAINSPLSFPEQRGICFAKIKKARSLGPFNFTPYLLPPVVVAVLL